MSCRYLRLCDACLVRVYGTALTQEREREREKKEKEGSDTTQTEKPPLEPDKIH